MVFQIEISEVALSDAEEYVRFIRETNLEPAAADRWYRGLSAAIFTLEKLPERCPIIPEQTEFSLEIRHLIYFSHRIIFHVNTADKLVTVYRIYHGSRPRLVLENLP